jgi:hypothetical protein
MPATAINPLAASVLRTNYSSFQSAAFGVAASMTGLLLNTFAVTPTRDMIRKKDHRGHEGILDIHSNPQIKANVDAENLQTTGTLNNGHPGAALSPAVVAAYTSDLAHGFPTTGVWVMGNPNKTAQPGDLQKITFELTLRWSPSTDVQIIQDTDAY